MSLVSGVGAVRTSWQHVGGFEDIPRTIGMHGCIPTRQTGRSDGFVTEDAMSRINTNISSIQAMHRLGSNQQDLSLRLERLSSGLRINRGSDDPAGLIASESLRSEITGINQAIENSTRAVNVIATAEGSLNEVSSLLLDLRGLINKSANEVLSPRKRSRPTSSEIDSILASVDRIANTTQFNGVNLH